ncbi:hypothetical protein CBL_10537, partial [Carabus blaptoides fortunei]
TLTNLSVTDSIEDDDVAVPSPQSATDSEPTPTSKRINRNQSHSVASVLENYLKNKSDKPNDDDPLEHFFLGMAFPVIYALMAWKTGLCKGYMFAIYVYIMENTMKGAGTISGEQKKTWHNLRSRTKGNKSKITSHSRATGGGSAPEESLNELDYPTINTGENLNLKVVGQSNGALQTPKQPKRKRGIESTHSNIDYEHIEQEVAEFSESGQYNDEGNGSISEEVPFLVSDYETQPSTPVSAAFSNRSSEKNRVEDNTKKESEYRSQPRDIETYDGADVHWRDHQVSTDEELEDRPPLPREREQKARPHIQQRHGVQPRRSTTPL